MGDSKKKIFKIIRHEVITANLIRTHQFQYCDNLNSKRNLIRLFDVKLADDYFVQNSNFARIKVGLYRTQPRFAALVYIKQTKVVFRGRVLYKRLLVYFIETIPSRTPRSCGRVLYKQTFAWIGLNTFLSNSDSRKLATNHIHNIDICILFNIHYSIKQLSKVKNDNIQHTKIISRRTSKKCQGDQRVFRTTAKICSWSAHVTSAAKRASMHNATVCFTIETVKQAVLLVKD